MIRGRDLDGRQFALTQAKRKALEGKTGDRQLHAVMRTVRKLSFILLGAVLAGCNSSSSSEWREVKTSSYETRFERAKAICNGRAAQTQVIAGRLWIAGAIAANSSFNACMAEQGFAPK